MRGVLTNIWKLGYITNQLVDSLEHSYHSSHLKIEFFYSYFPRVGWKWFTFPIFFETSKNKLLLILCHSFEQGTQNSLHPTPCFLYLSLSPSNMSPIWCTQPPVLSLCSNQMFPIFDVGNLCIYTCISTPPSICYLIFLILFSTLFLPSWPPAEFGLSPFSMTLSVPCHTNLSCPLALCQHDLSW